MKPIVAGLQPQTYQRHPIHSENRVWVETNCYVDVLVELVHGLGFEPVAALPFTLTIDFEGDQWTFFKFPDADLRDLFGLDIQELAVWRPLVEQIQDQVEAGRPVLVELDSFYLPDTAGTAYQLGHVKTTVAVNEIDIERRHMGYFHNQGYYNLGAEDFAQIFHLDGLPHPSVLPPYVEIVKRSPLPALSGSALLDASLALLKRNLALAPRDNPFLAFKEKFTRDLDWLMQADIAAFHVYSFANLRQYGACFELAETYMGWLAAQGVGDTDTAAAAFHQIAETAKAFQFQLARSMARKKPLDLTALDTMAQLWSTGLSELRRHHG